MTSVIDAEGGRLRLRRSRREISARVVGAIARFGTRYVNQSILRHGIKAGLPCLLIRWSGLEVSAALSKSPDLPYMK